MLIQLLSKCQKISSSLQEKFVQLKAEASKVEDTSCFNNIVLLEYFCVINTLGVDGGAVYCST